MLQKDNEGNVFYDINFCPYCRTLILEEFDWRILNTEIKLLKDNVYKCNSCHKDFTLSDIKYPTRSKHQTYKLSKNTTFKGTPLDQIKNIVQRYREKGYTYKQIHEYTCFSIEIIQKCLKSKKNYCNSALCSEKELICDYLHIKDNDDICIKIQKALKFGCEYKVIEKLFSVSSKTISSIKKEILSIDVLHKVKLIDEKYYILEIEVKI